MEGRESMVVSPAPAPPPPTGMTAGPDMYQRAHSGGGGSSAMAAAAPVLRQHSMSSPMGVSIASNNANANAVSSPPYQHHPHQHQHQHHGSEQHQNQHQHHGSDAMVSHGMNMGMGGNPLHRMEPLKRKRGRPRKYGPDGNMALALAPLSAAPSLFSPSSKRGRGRPPGSGKKQQLAALGSAGIGFTPHVITIASGEDVASKIMSFSQQGPRAVCILSANGAISNVTLRQPATSGGTVTYEGRFEILSLSGSFLLTENGGTRSRTGGLSVTLAGPDGRIVGGGVAGLLMAASPVQVVVGSFLSSCRKPQQRPPESSSGMPQANAGGAATVSSPVSRGTMSESSGGPGSPMNQSTGDFNSAPSVPSQPMQSMPSYQSMAWPASQPMGEQRRSTDINMSLPAG